MSSAIIILAILAACMIIGGVIVAIVIAATKKQSTPIGTVADGYESYFDGNAFEWLGWQIVACLISAFSFGIAFPWAMCMLTKWEVEHTVISGKRLKFTGTGGQLFGKYILWSFLTFITFGIYSIWFGLGMEKWRVKHIVYAYDDSPVESTFTAGAGSWFVNHLVFALISGFTLGIGTPWAAVRLMRWKAQNTIIGESPLVFNGTGGQLFVHYLIGGILSGITCGIYSIFFVIRLLKWQYSNTYALCRTPEIIKKSRAHEESAMADYAKIRLAANDTELAAMKSGFTGNESREQLEALAQGGNPYAQYELALLLKGDSERFEGEALSRLKASSDALYHNAMLAYADYVTDIDARAALLENAAKHGNQSAPWILKGIYEAKAKALPDAPVEPKIEMLAKSAYWFKVAIELEAPAAIAAKADYDLLCERIAIFYCKTAPIASSSGAVVGIIIAIVCGVIAMFAVLAALAGFLFNVRVDSRPAQSTDMQTHVGTIHMTDKNNGSLDYSVVYDSDLSNGIIDGDGVSSIIENEQPTESEPDNNNDNTPDGSYGLSEQIVGSWSTALLEGDTLYVTTFVFNADGTLSLYDSEYLNSADHAELFGSGDLGWQPAPMGFPATYGTFSCNDDGTTISICYTYDDIEEFTPMYVTGHVMEIGNGSMLFQIKGEYGDGVPCKYLKNVSYDNVEELCAMLGVELP